MWHGCEVAAHDYNDVAILPDGGFVGTYPTGLSSGGSGGPFGGAVTGYVARWDPGKGESEMHGHADCDIPTASSSSANGRFMYVNEFSGRQVFKYDLKSEKSIGSVKVDFLPDNLTWTKEGHLLGGGSEGRARRLSRRQRPALYPGLRSGGDRSRKNAVAAHLRFRAHEPLIGGVSVALKVGDSIYLGAFQGDRLVKIPYPK